MKIPIRKHAAEKLLRVFTPITGHNYTYMYNSLSSDPNDLHLT